jgi:hypothetical protein
MKKIITIATIAVFLCTSCAEMLQIANQYELTAPLSETEIANGLKEALKIGTDSANSRLAAKDGYFGDELIKILLPPEANIIVNNANKIPGGQKLINDVILGINRTAEDAAKDAGPIFAKAITEMTIRDAANILQGTDSAATVYFKSKTYEQLYNLYNPKINQSLEKDLMPGISTQKTWNTLTSNYNTVASSFVGKMANLTPVELKLDSYLTHKALDGLFIKIADEEKKIRTNPKARVTDLLKRVFK